MKLRFKDVKPGDMIVSMLRYNKATYLCLARFPALTGMTRFVWYLRGVGIVDQETNVDDLLEDYVWVSVEHVDDL